MPPRAAAALQFHAGQGYIATTEGKKTPKQQNQADEIDFSTLACSRFLSTLI